MVDTKMKVNACIKCKGLFQTFVKADVCPICQDILNKKFRTVKVYIRDNKEAGIEEVSQSCNVDPKQILRWVREERLFFLQKHLKLQSRVLNAVI